LDFVNSCVFPKKYQLLLMVFLYMQNLLVACFYFFFCWFIFIFDFLQDVHILDLIDIVSTSSFIHVDEGSGVVNDNVHHTNFVVDQQRFVVAIANDLGLEKPHVDSIGVFQKKMMV